MKLVNNRVALTFLLDFCLKIKKNSMNEYKSN